MADDTKLFRYSGDRDDSHALVAVMNGTVQNYWVDKNTVLPEGHPAVKTNPSLFIAVTETKAGRGKK